MADSITIIPHQTKTYQYKIGMPARRIGLLAIDNKGKFKTTIIIMAINSN